MNAADEASKRRIRTRSGVAVIGGVKTDVMVQQFGNTFVVMVSMLPVPALVMRCASDNTEAGGLGAFRSELLLGKENPALSVVGRQLIQSITKTSRCTLTLYLGIKPALTEPEKAHATIAELIAAVEGLALW